MQRRISELETVLDKRRMEFDQAAGALAECRAMIGFYDRESISMPAAPVEAKAELFTKPVEDAR